MKFGEPVLAGPGHVTGLQQGGPGMLSCRLRGPNKSALPHRPFDKKVVPGTVIFLPFLEKKSLKRIFRVQT